MSLYERIRKAWNRHRTPRTMPPLSEQNRIRVREQQRKDERAQLRKELGRIDEAVEAITRRRSEGGV